MEPMGRVYNSLRVRVPNLYVLWPYSPDLGIVGSKYNVLFGYMDP